jgi:plastocyanin
MRLLLLAGAAVLVAAACNSIPQGTVQFPTATEFIPYVADSIAASSSDPTADPGDNIGRGNAVTVDADGVPYFSYWGFPAKVGPNDIPVQRPIGVPFLPAVQVSSETDGLFTHGAAAQSRATPTGVTIPYGPDEVDSLTSATPQNTNGTDIAITADGTKHVVWAADTGIWYASGSSSFAAEQVTEQAPQLDVSGPLGWPSIAVDASDTPWIAYTENTGTHQDVTVATPKGNGWELQVAAQIPLCAGCAEPQRTEIVIGPSGPVVLYVDTAARSLMAAFNDHENGWVSFQVEGNVSGGGLSATVDGNGTIWASYFTGLGRVDLATSTDGTTWSAAKAVDAADDAQGPAPDGATTAIAAADDGTLALAWYDAAADAVKLVKGSPDALKPIALGDATAGGLFPAVAVTGDGSHVFLTWYAEELQNLMLGVYGEAKDLEVAAPSPIPSPGETTPTETTCKPDGTDITIVASGDAFDLDCIAVEAGTPFTVELDNQDPTTLHDFSIYRSQGDTSNPFFTSSSDPAPGGQTTPYKIDPIDEAGSYYFQCDFHPTSMFGTFVVAKGGKK